jgi:hypothetical protein
MEGWIGRQIERQTLNRGTLCKQTDGWSDGQTDI